jgi:hypothetical protein
MHIHPLDPVYSKELPLKRKLLNTSIIDDDNKEIAVLCVYFFEEDFSNKLVREVSYKVLGDYNCSEEVVLDQIKDEIIKRSFKPVIFQ